MDVTNRCNLNCPICINNTPSMGFLFEPPLEYFGKIFAHYAATDPPPSIQLFGGEPTVRDDLFDIIRMARSHGLATRVVTNGIKLADIAYCRRLIETKATILLAYDGGNPDTYRVLRNNEKSLQLKQTAIENIRRVGGAKVTLMCLAAKGFNDTELPSLFQFCHDRRDVVRAIYFMPLAHTWDRERFELEPDRITGEDIEQIVADAFPGDPVAFLPPPPPRAPTGRRRRSSPSSSPAAPPTSRQSTRRVGSRSASPSSAQTPPTPSSSPSSPTPRPPRSSTQAPPASRPRAS